ncbi:MAG: copper resistance protein NlpE [Clostridia bacterium]|nr:copper resistance protein NlpE [Clostridia bacterium]
MKKAAVAVLLLALVACLCACGGEEGTGNNITGEGMNKPGKDSFSGGTYVWEKDGFGGDFTITFNSDGTYEYSVGYLSSYLGMGSWETDNGVLTMTETGGYDLSFRFAVEDGGLRYIAEGSDAFMGVTVEDGDRFVANNG